MNRYRPYFEPGILALLLMLPAGAASPLVSTTWAQAPVTFEGLPLDPTMDPLSDKYNQTQYKKLEVMKQQVLSERLPLDQTANELRRWYGLMFAQMTQVDRLDRLPALRQELLKDLASTRSEPVHTFVLGTVYRGMDLLRRESMSVSGKVYRLHPAVRFNAILLMGDLNAQERGIQRQQPVPYRPALGAMVTVFRDPKEPESSRMAALLGILRHAKLDWTLSGPEKFTPAQRTGLISIMKGVVDQKTPPAGSSPEGLLWMRRRAIETLGVLGAVGDDPGVTTTLVALVGDAKAPSSLRCAAANALRYTPPQGKLEPVLASKRLGQLATAICQNELAWMEKIKEKDAQKKLNAAGGSPGMGGYPGMGGMEGYDPSGGMGMPGVPGMGMDADERGGPDMEGLVGTGADAGGYGAMMGAGMMGAGMMGGMGGSGFKPLMPEDPRLNLARRRLKYQLVAIDNGLRGTLRAAGTGGSKADVDKVTSQFKQILAATDIAEGENPTLDTLAEQVRKAMREMESLTAEPEAPAAIDEAEITGGPAGGIAPAPAAAAPAVAAPAVAAPAGPRGVPAVAPAVPPAQPPAVAP